MTYIVERSNRFYVVTYDGLDPLSGRERRRWIPIGLDRGEAEAVVARSTANVSQARIHAEARSPSQSS